MVGLVVLVVLQYLPAVNVTHVIDSLLVVNSLLQLQGCLDSSQLEGLLLACVQQYPCVHMAYVHIWPALAPRVDPVTLLSYTLRSLG